jgi:hypothetical protein
VSLLFCKYFQTHCPPLTARDARFHSCPWKRPHTRGAGAHQRTITVGPHPHPQPQVGGRAPCIASRNLDLSPWLTGDLPGKVTVPAVLEGWWWGASISNSVCMVSEFTTYLRGMSVLSCLLALLSSLSVCSCSTALVDTQYHSPQHSLLTGHF